MNLDVNLIKWRLYQKALLSILSCRGLLLTKIIHWKYMNLIEAGLKGHLWCLFFFMTFYFLYNSYFVFKLFIFQCSTITKEQNAAHQLEKEARKWATKIAKETRAMRDYSRTLRNLQGQSGSDKVWFDFFPLPNLYIHPNKIIHYTFFGV